MVCNGKTLSSRWLFPVRQVSTNIFSESNLALSGGGENMSNRKVTCWHHVSVYRWMHIDSIHVLPLLCIPHWHHVISIASFVLLHCTAGMNHALWFNSLMPESSYCVMARNARELLVSSKSANLRAYRLSCLAKYWTNIVTNLKASMQTWDHSST